VGGFLSQPILHPPLIFLSKEILTHRWQSTNLYVLKFTFQRNLRLLFGCLKPSLWCFVGVGRHLCSFHIWIK
jgi:hypothetical protein